MRINPSHAAFLRRMLRLPCRQRLLDPGGGDSCKATPDSTPAGRSAVPLVQDDATERNRVPADAPAGPRRPQRSKEVQQDHYSPVERTSLERIWPREQLTSCVKVPSVVPLSDSASDKHIPGSAVLPVPTSSGSLRVSEAFSHASIPCTTKHSIPKRGFAAALLQSGRPDG